MQPPKKQSLHLSDDAAPPDMPLMIWDGECEFCDRWIERWRRWTGGRIRYETCQQVGDRFPPFTVDEYRKAVYLIEPDGRVSRAAEAVFRSLWLAGRFRWAFRLYRQLPVFAELSEAVYGWVARNRDRLVRWGF